MCECDLGNGFCFHERLGFEAVHFTAECTVRHVFPLLASSHSPAPADTDSHSVNTSTHCSKGALGIMKFPPRTPPSFYCGNEQQRQVHSTMWQTAKWLHTDALTAWLTEENIFSRTDTFSVCRPLTADEHLRPCIDNLVSNKINKRLLVTYLLSQVSSCHQCLPLSLLSCSCFAHTPSSLFISLSHSLLQTLVNILHLNAYLCLLSSSAPTLARKSAPGSATQRKPSWTSREKRKREREGECDEQMQIGDTNGGGI